MKTRTARRKTRANDRWGPTLIREMSSAYLTNVIRYIVRLQKYDLKKRKLDALVVEARRRGLPLPDHRWVIGPVEKIAEQAEELFCPRCHGVLVPRKIEDGYKCINCDHIEQSTNEIQ